MFTTKKLYKIILRNLIVSLFFITGSAFCVFWASNKIETLTDSISLNQKLRAQLKERSELIAVLEKDVKLVGDNNILIKESFVPAENISNFINDLDKLASQNSINQIYRFETPKPSDLSGLMPISSINYTNNMTADLTNLVNYLKSFENMPYFTKIEGINISSQDKALGWLGQSSVSFKAVLLTKTTE